jgi:hypothetical protein
MRNIYSDADSVIAWLGSDCPRTDTAVDILLSLAQIWVERAGEGITEENFTLYILRSRLQGISLFRTEKDIV